MNIEDFDTCHTEKKTNKRKQKTRTIFRMTMDNHRGFTYSFLVGFYPLYTLERERTQVGGPGERQREGESA